MDPTKNAPSVGSGQCQIDKNLWSADALSEWRNTYYPFEAQVRVRYKALEQPASVTPLEGKRVHVRLLHPQRAITPGEAAVFDGGEDGDEVLWKESLHLSDV